MWCCWRWSRHSDMDPRCTAPCLQAEECTHVRLWFSRDCASKTNMQEKRLLNRVVILVFFEHKKYYLLSMQGYKALRFGTTWGWVINDRIEFLGWTNPLNFICCSRISLIRYAHGPLAKRLMHMADKSGNTSGVSKSSSDWLNYTEFPGDVCVVFFNVQPGNKNAVTPNPLTKEESHRVYNCDDERLLGQLNAGFSEVCEIFNGHGI